MNMASYKNGKLDINYMSVMHQGLYRQYFSFKSVWENYSCGCEAGNNDCIKFFRMLAEKNHRAYLWQIYYYMIDSKEGKSVIITDMDKLCDEGRLKLDCLDSWISKNCSDRKDFCRRNREVIMDIADSIKFTESSLQFFLFFLFIHMSADADIMASEIDMERMDGWNTKELNGKTSLEFIKDILERKSNSEYFLNEIRNGSKEIMLPPEENIQLPLYDGTIGISGELRVIRLTADKSIEKCSIRLGKSTIERILRGGSSIYAVWKGEGFVSFLPELAVSENTFMIKEENGRLCAKTIDNTIDTIDTIDITGTEEKLEIYTGGGKGEPVSFSYCLHGRRGGLTADSNGSLWVFGHKIDAGEPNVISVCDTILDFAILMNNGKIRCGKNVNDLKKINDAIKVNMVLDEGAVIHSNRKCTIIRPGEEPLPLGFSNVMEVYAMRKHYIVLDMYGNAFTDMSIENPISGVSDIGICEKGYIVYSKGNVPKLICFDDDNGEAVTKKEESWPYINEIVSSCKRIWFYTDEKKIIRCKL